MSLTTKMKNIITIKIKFGIKLIRVSKVKGGINPNNNNNNNRFMFESSFLYLFIFTNIMTLMTIQ